MLLMHVSFGVIFCTTAQDSMLALILYDPPHHVCPARVLLRYLAAHVAIVDAACCSTA